MPSVMDVLDGVRALVALWAPRQGPPAPGGGTAGLDWQVALVPPGGQGVNWAEINATSSGDNTLVAGVAGKIIRVIAVTFTTDTAISISWKSAGNIIVHPMFFAANGGMDVKRAPDTYFMQTNAGEALILNNSGAANTRGSLNYLLI